MDRGRSELVFPAGEVGARVVVRLLRDLRLRRDACDRVKSAYKRIKLVYLEGKVIHAHSLAPLVSLGERRAEDFRRTTWVGETGVISFSNEKSSHSSSDGDLGKSSRGTLGRRLFEKGSTDVEEAIDKCRCKVAVDNRRRADLAGEDVVEGTGGELS